CVVSGPSELCVTVVVVVAPDASTVLVCVLVGTRLPFSTDVVVGVGTLLPSVSVPVLVVCVPLSRYTPFLSACSLTTVVVWPLTVVVCRLDEVTVPFAPTTEYSVKVTPAAPVLSVTWIELPSGYVMVVILIGDPAGPTAYEIVCWPPSWLGSAAELSAPAFACASSY